MTSASQTSPQNAKKMSVLRIPLFWEPLAGNGFRTRPFVKTATNRWLGEIFEKLPLGANSVKRVQLYSGQRAPKTCLQTARLGAFSESMQAFCSLSRSGLFF